MTESELPGSVQIIEYARYQPLLRKWLPPFLPTDRYQFSELNGKALPNFSFLSYEEKPSAAEWSGDWQVSSDWEYAVDFPFSYHRDAGKFDVVRRRVWVRFYGFSDATRGPEISTLQKLESTPRPPSARAMPQSLPPTMNALKAPWTARQAIDLLGGPPPRGLTASSIDRALESCPPPPTHSSTRSSYKSERADSAPSSRQYNQPPTGLDFTTSQVTSRRTNRHTPRTAQLHSASGSRKSPLFPHLLLS